MAFLSLSSLCCQLRQIHPSVLTLSYTWLRNALYTAPFIHGYAVREVTNMNLSSLTVRACPSRTSEPKTHKHNREY